MPMRFSKKLASRPLHWLLLTLTSYFSWRLMSSKLGLGTVLSQKQNDSQYHLVAYASQSLNTHMSITNHSTKQELLALKWVIAKQFEEYLLWKPFIIRNDNNPLTYIMTTPNLDAAQALLGGVTSKICV